ncbi:diacylglycerol kinase eta-like isoform X2 [Planococcus citri]|uniref:diacylglycerol kinase eta-like isoform X2 n=1 Tax=Planococcus citri TaxID=170843 RepID=UPI0031F98230
MEDWFASLKASSNNQGGSDDIQKILSGHHTWHATSHARPTYCNVCREQLSGVTSHGFSCEVCKCKVHKRCVAKTISNCKWTTLASVGKDIIEDKQGNILMPHQWMEGNLPVSAKCAVCEKTCGSVLRLQDWRCLWCRATVHTACRPKYSIRCLLGPNHVSVVPPTAIHSIGTDDAWEAVRPHGCSPLLVFVNSKSGDNQGVKFLRRFRQILNPAQVFDLITSGPTLGLRLFRHFDPFRVLVCSGDGSVGWVLSEIDRLNMQVQCEVGVLPLGTGNDLARVLGWGASCDDDTHLPQLIERYERASPKILDRWSIMVFERSIKVGDGGKLTLNTGLMEGSNLVTTAAAYEDSVLSHLTKILQSDQHTVVISSAKILCETVKDFISKISDVTLMQGDEDFSEKCLLLKSKLNHLLQVLQEEQKQMDSALEMEARSMSRSESVSEEKFSNEVQEKHEPSPKPKHLKLKKDQLLLRVNSLKRAVRRVVEHTEKAVDEQNFTSSLFPSSPGSRSANSAATVIKDSHVLDENRLSPASPPLLIPNVGSISPLPDFRRDSSCSAEINLESLPVPKEFADSRHGSFAETDETEKSKFLFEFSETEAYHFVSNIQCHTDNHLTDVLNEIKNKKEKEIEDDEDDEEEEEYNDEKDNMFYDRTGSTNNKKGGSKSVSINRSSLRDSIKESEHSFPISIEGVCNVGSELDMTNLFSTSPEDDEECSEEYRREMGLDFAKRCSIAHFIEGSDIARKSIKCRHRKKSFDDLDNECIAVNPDQESSTEIDKKSASFNTVLEIPKIHVSAENASLCGLSIKDDINLRIRGSHNNLASSTEGLFLSGNDIKPDRRSTLSETDDEEYARFYGLLKKGETIANSGSTGLTVIIDPPSPVHVPVKDEAADHEQKPPNESVRRLSESCRRLSAASPLMSVHCSPSPTRRISNISLALSDSTDQQKDTLSKSEQKTLPIINPLVRLPQWPNVTEAGIVGKVLLANADALCAAAVPLMDPDETLMEGFFERCVMNNYFGIGIDAKISLDFHHKREEHPEKCRSRTRNYMWYGVLGSKQWLQKTCKNLDQRVQLECDGQRIPLPSLQGIVVLNIPSFMGGINFWGGTKEDDIFLAPSIDDHILEVVAVFGTVQMAASRLINLQHHRIAQCSTVQINILGEESIPIQVDGEAWIQPPGMIRIIHKNRMKMLYRDKSLESSLRAWEVKQRCLRQQQRLASDVNKLTDEELSVLLDFIEAASSLLKYIKLILARNPTIEKELYHLSAAVGINIERVHPDNKLLPPPDMRATATELVKLTKRLVEETNQLLLEKNLAAKIAPEIQRQLNCCLIQMEIELKKCIFGGTSSQPLVFFNSISPDEVDRKFVPGRKSSGAFWQRFRRGSGVSVNKYSRKEVSSWGVPEVTNWLESLQLNEYCESFALHDVRGRELLNLTRTDLKELGVTKVGHVKRLLLAIKDFGP